MQVPDDGNEFAVLRKGLWTVLYAAIGAAATMGARRVSSRIWRLLTGEAPPARR